MISAKDITNSTGGWFTKRMIQNRHAKGLWLSATTPPAAGKAYNYSDANFCEAVIVSSLLRNGFTHESANGVIRWRLRNCFRKRDTGYAVQDSKFADLPELHGGSWLWGVVAKADAQGKWGMITSGVVATQRIATLEDRFEDVESYLVLNIGLLLANARKAIAVTLGKDD